MEKSVFFPLIIVREYNTPMGHMVHCVDEVYHYVFLNDCSRLSLIKISNRFHQNLPCLDKRNA